MRCEFLSAWTSKIRMASGAGAAGWMQIAEEPAESLLLIPGQFLVAEEDHLVRHQSVVDFLEHLIAERLRQVDACDFRPNHRADRCYVNPFVGHVASWFNIHRLRRYCREGANVDMSKNGLSPATVTRKPLRTCGK